MFLRNYQYVRRLCVANPHNFKYFGNTSQVSKNHQHDVENEVEKAKDSDFKENAPTIFDKILSREIKADVIFEDDKCLAFNDVSPQGPVHFLIIPKRKIAKLEHGRQSDVELFGHLLLQAGTLGKERAPNGFRVVVNNGKEGAQSVYHLHLHVIGGRQMNWPPG